MAVAHHRAPLAYAVPTRWAAALALAIGVIAGSALSLSSAPEQGIQRGLLLGLILGVPAAVAVVFTRRAIDQGATAWLVAAVGLGTLVLVATLLFALTQLDLGMAPVGAGLAIAVGGVSLGTGLRLSHERREREQAPVHRR